MGSMDQHNAVSFGRFDGKFGSMRQMIDIRNGSTGGYLVW